MTHTTTQDVACAIREAADYLARFSDEGQHRSISGPGAGVCYDMAQQLRDNADILEKLAALSSQTQDWPRDVLNRDRTMEVLTQHNAWRRGGDGPQTDPVLLGLALDAVIAALSPPQDAVRSLVSKWRDAAATERDYYADALRDCANQLEATLSPAPEQKVPMSEWVEAQHELNELRAEVARLHATQHPAAPERVDDVEYEYEVWQGDAWQAGGSSYDLEVARDEANHYAMMYGQDGPVEIRMYEKRALTAAMRNDENTEWVMVPRVPTPEMIEAWAAAPMDCRDEWAAMLAAAPQPKEALVICNCHTERQRELCRKRKECVVAYATGKQITDARPSPEGVGDECKCVCHSMKAGMVHSHACCVSPVTPTPQEQDSRDGQDGERGEATGDTTTFADAWAKLRPIDRTVISAYFNEPSRTPHPAAHVEGGARVRVNERCQRVMRERGKPYPRTCYVCGLQGKCVTADADLYALAAPADGEGRV